jgi:hypothetical protein
MKSDHARARSAAFANIFGESDPPGAPLPPNDPDLAVNWPDGGIFVFPPRGDRRGFHYVTHGISDAFDFELVLSTPERHEWPERLLVELARYLLLVEDAVMILPGDRMPTGAFKQVAPRTKLTHIFATTSTEYQTSLVFADRQCSLVHLVGATSEEIEQAKKEGGAFGTKVLGETLRRMRIGFVTDTARISATEDPTFDAAWHDVATSVQPS